MCAQGSSQSVGEALTKTCKRSNGARNTTSRSIKKNKISTKIATSGRDNTEFLLFKES